MTTTHLEPPKDLPSGPTILRALVVPFDEAILPPHKDAGHRFQWATVRAPADPEKVSMNLDHDTSEVGMIVAAVKRSDGIWASIKVGLTAERLIAAGYVGVSPEISEDGELIGVALCKKAPAGLLSARIVDLPSFTSAEAPTERASVPSFPPIGLGTKAPEAPTEFKSALAWGQVGETMTIWGTGGKASDLEEGPKLKQPPGSFNGAPVLSQIDPVLEAERARRRFEEIRAGLKEWEEWPETFLRQHRKNYQILCEQFDAERARDAAEQRRKAELARDAELREALAAIASPPSRRWWQWWRS
jgi:hypothetical protein